MRSLSFFSFFIILVSCIHPKNIHTSKIGKGYIERANTLGKENLQMLLFEENFYKHLTWKSHLSEVKPRNKKEAEECEALFMNSPLFVLDSNKIETDKVMCLKSSRQLMKYLKMPKDTFFDYLIYHKGCIQGHIDLQRNPNGEFVSGFGDQPPTEGWMKEYELAKSKSNVNFYILLDYIPFRGYQDETDGELYIINPFGGDNKLKCVKLYEYLNKEYFWCRREGWKTLHRQP